MQHKGFVVSICLACVCGSLCALNPYERHSTLYAIVERDSQLIPHDLMEWISKQDIPIKHFNKKASKVNYEKILTKVHQASKYVKKPVTVGLRPEHAWKNVFAGCAPYDETRSLRDLEGFYISASDVLTPCQHYIVGESPVYATEDIFWQAVIEANIRTVIALVTPPEGAYWDSNRFPKVIKKWKVKKVSEQKVATSPFFPHHAIIKRIFTLSHHHRDEKRTVTHLQYENWPDHDAPESTLFHRFLDIIDAEHPGSEYPIFVHCAAGVGRSGTFVAAHSLRRDVLMHDENDGHLVINVAKRIVEMRMQRYRLLSRPTQLQAVFEAVRDAINKRAWKATPKALADDDAHR